MLLYNISMRALFAVLFALVPCSFAFPPGCSSLGCDPFRSRVVHGILLDPSPVLGSASAHILVEFPTADLPASTQVLYDTSGIGCIGSGVAATCLAGDALVQLNSSGTTQWSWRESGQQGLPPRIPGTQLARMLPVAGYSDKIETASTSAVAYVRANGSTQWIQNIIPDLTFGVISPPVTNNRSLNFYTRSDGYTFGYDDRSTPVAQIPTRVCKDSGCTSSKVVAAVSAPTVAGQRVVYVGGVLDIATKQSSGTCAAIAYDQADSIVKRLQTAWQVTFPCDFAVESWPPPLPPLGNSFVFSQTPASSSNYLRGPVAPGDRAQDQDASQPIPVPVVGLSWATPEGDLAVGAITAFPEGLDPTAQQPNTSLAWTSAGLADAIETKCPGSPPSVLGITVEPLQFDAPIGPGSPQLTSRLWVTPRQCGAIFPLSPADGSVQIGSIIDVAGLLGHPAVVLSAPQLVQVNATAGGEDRVLALVVAPEAAFSPTPRLGDLEALLLSLPTSGGTGAAIASRRPLCSGTSGQCEARVLAVGQPAFPQSDSGADYSGPAMVVPTWVKPSAASNLTRALATVLPVGLESFGALR